MCHLQYQHKVKCLLITGQHCKFVNNTHGTYTTKKLMKNMLTEFSWDFFVVQLSRVTWI